MIELNGVTNLHMILDMAYQDGKVDQTTYEYSKNELEMLERYMLAISDCYKKEQEGIANMIPYWHEIKATPRAFPTRKERV